MNPSLDDVLRESAASLESLAADLAGTDEAFRNGTVRESIASERQRIANELEGTASEASQSSEAGGENRE